MTASTASAHVNPARGDAVRLWREGLAALSAADPDMGRAAAEAGEPAFELREPGFPTLLRAIVAQQVSAASARAIWARLEAALHPVSAEGFLALDEEAVRGLGFSRPKLAYARGLAEAVASGACDLDALADLPDDAALAELVRLKGIGRWTAEVYLLFALGRPDVWPAQDLALAVAAQKIKNLPSRPTFAEMDALAEAWRPWRSVAAILLWHYYRKMP
ncbi:DNA-3-methyladenine glycosylase II [Constrictibacter sp. MBR-5]|jgi:DNA-3-methyladenine glycosylase II|uniref:DNA-3-methyladenine glycosylase family protein n=1 Tax=Constrictibacter sp. MBR-5 TaxID=3156467 RepID=UPI0033995C64